MEVMEAGKCLFYGSLGPEILEKVVAFPKILKKILAPRNFTQFTAL